MITILNGRKRKVYIALGVVLVAAVVVIASAIARAEISDILPRANSGYTSAQPLRLAEGINPPTNSWISGAVFNKDGLFAPV